jgi:hypothetical protein
LNTGVDDWAGGAVVVVGVEFSVHVADKRDAETERSGLNVHTSSTSPSAAVDLL